MNHDEVILSVCEFLAECDKIQMNGGLNQAGRQLSRTVRSTGITISYDDLEFFYLSPHPTVTPLSMGTDAHVCVRTPMVTPPCTHHTTPTTHPSQVHVRQPFLL